MTVALDTHITKELEEECAAREFVNRIQTIRKNQGFQCDGPDSHSQRVRAGFGGGVKNIFRICLQ